MLERVLAALAAERAYDSIVLDLGTGLDRPIRRMAAWADTLLVIATEEPTSLTDAYAVLKLHAADRAGGGCPRGHQPGQQRPPPGDAPSTRSRGACATFLGRQPPLAGIIRRDDHVREAIRRQTLLQVCHPDTAAVQDVTRLAAGLLEPARTPRLPDA